MSQIPAIISDCSHNSSDFVRMTGQHRFMDQVDDSNARSLGPAHEKPSRSEPFEVAIQRVGQELAQLDQEPQIRILTLWLFTVHCTVSVVPKHDSYLNLRHKLF